MLVTKRMLPVLISKKNQDNVGLAPDMCIEAAAEDKSPTNKGWHTVLKLHSTKFVAVRRNQ